MPSASPTPLPLPEEKTELVSRLVTGLDAPALQWLSGYMAGAAALLHGDATAHPAAAAPAVDDSARLTVIYGSQTGNAKRVAEQLAQRAESAGLAVRLLRADAYPVRELKTERLLYVVISTQGEGEPPDDARGLVEFLAGRRAPKLPDLKYAVFGLGDSSYPEFCAMGRQIDARLAELGADAVQPRVDADVDVDSEAGPWLEAVLGHARTALGESHAAPMATVTPLRRREAVGTRDKPFSAEVLDNQRITSRDSGVQVHHLELSLEDSGIRYQPGDAVGVWPTQAPALVDTVLQALDLDGDETVEHGGESLPLHRWLGERRELTRLTRPFVAAHAERGNHEQLQALLEPGGRQALGELFDSHQLADLLAAHRSDWDAASLVAALRPLVPRLYSIASSPLLVEDEVHLTVDRIDYRHGDQARWGVASRYLADRTGGETVPLFIEANERFRLPDDTGRDVIMIGPGTGVAPFRGFVQHREAQGASGRNWLFFGHRHQRHEFLYQLEWQAALKSGALHRLDVAFSRDQADKLYVQHRLREQGRELYDWIENGAHVYVCGDATRMARDVDVALREVAVTHGGRDADGAAEWLQALAAAGRYARDVY